ncbi:unnamed protein product [Withania somnifera]
MSPPQSPNSSRDQVRPLAPSSHRIHVENEEEGLKKKRRKRRCIKCCGCCGVTTIIIGIIILILALTVFKVKEPTIRMESIKFEGLSALTSSSNLQTNLNITRFADISIKNPNAVSFKFKATTLGSKDVRMNTKVIILVEKLVGIPRLTSDLIVNLGVIKKSVGIRMNCDLVVDLQRQDVKDMDCERKVSL